MLSIKNWKQQRSEFGRRGIRLPQFDVDQVRAAGVEQPRWIHFGGGNLYRAFHAAVAQDVMESGDLDRGVVVLETYSPLTIDKVYAPWNNDLLQAIMERDGSIDCRLIASTAGAYFANPARPDDYARVRRYFESPVLQMCTFTITEKGYTVADLDAEVAAGPDQTTSTMGIVSAFLLARFRAGAAPIAMVSTDNFSRNGERFRQEISAVVEAWTDAGIVDKEFLAYVSDERCVSFPWTMIDRITPNPSPETADALQKLGFCDLELIDAGHGATFAGFSNTERAHYLVIEDSFPNGRPALERGGVIMSDRATAERADTMKVTACLNPLHTCLAVYGCLLGYTRIWQEMENPDLVSLIRHIGYDEDLPVVEDPGVINPKEFIDELIDSRLPNRSLPDAPQRIASDTSQKMSIRFGHTILAYADRGRDPSELIYIPLAIAGWLRYLMAIDDAGESFELSPDPLLADLRALIAPLRVGASDPAEIHAAVSPILSDASIFGVDLYEVNLAEKVEGYLAELLSEVGAVAETIKKYA
ncbi:Mannitol dehydrogenase domain protein [Coriobacterium glomerans PW2]|uniref:Mannitol dehydrogenase domain protein n=1 Tax=Coriobacterium glomerans (strain ATCC 49209 / DSM 20642 / JCM 10262 / PW2) TaxID=700015 RepID=F2NBD2_CORGP|nr:mannitol dehydrogenase family protein [Coriobacterium glomerans]AEB06668.1 Mannitol dehydrogenase domain protein [Coriobacterium glomerans PW2]